MIEICRGCQDPYVLNEDHYSPGERVERACPGCGELIVFNIPKSEPEAPAKPSSSPVAAEEPRTTPVEPAVATTPSPRSSVPSSSLPPTSPSTPSPPLASEANKQSKMLLLGIIAVLVVILGFVLLRPADDAPAASAATASTEASAEPASSELSSSSGYEITTGDVESTLRSYYDCLVRENYPELSTTLAPYMERFHGIKESTSSSTVISNIETTQRRFSNLFFDIKSVTPMSDNKFRYRVISQTLDLSRGVAKTWDIEGVVGLEWVDGKLKINYLNDETAHMLSKENYPGY